MCCSVLQRAAACCRVQLMAQKCTDFKFYNSSVSVNLFASAFWNGSGTRIVLLSAKTNPSVEIRRKKHRNPPTKPVRAVIHDYWEGRAILSRKWHTWKDCPGDLTLLNTDNVDFCTRSRPYQREAFGPSGPGPWTVAKTLFVFAKKRYVSKLSCSPP